MRTKLLAVLLALSMLLTGCTRENPASVDSSASNPIYAAASITQNVIPDPNNSSTANIASGANFTGRAKSTLGVNAIQVSLKTDQDMIVYVEQSPDGINWDIPDHKDYLYSLGGAGWTFTAINSYYRVVVVNANGSSTTYFRLQSVLCPFADPLPRATSDDDRLMTKTTITDAYDFEAEMSPDNELRIAQSVKLAGGLFSGPPLDPNFWTANTSNNGNAYIDTRSATSGGELTLATNTTANGAARVSSLRRGRYVAGNANFGKITMHLPDTGTTNNTRRWGIADYSTITSITDGAYFQLSSSNFSVVTMRGGATNVTTSGAFNGKYGSVYHLDTNNVHIYEIYYTSFAVYFSIDGKLLHTITTDPMPWSNTETLYIYMDNVNSGGQNANVIMHVRSASIHRLGPTFSSPKYTHISTATTTICKYSAGTLQSVIINNPSNNDITIYDNTAASGTVIAVIRPGASTTPIALPYGLDFYNGLTIVTAGSPDITVIYE